MGAWTGRRPAGSPPTLHSHQFGCWVHLDDTVDLAVWVGVVLAGILLLAVHVYGCDAKVAAFRRGQGNLAAAVFVSVQLRRSHPALLQPLLDVSAEVLVVRISRPILGVQPCLQIFAWCSFSQGEGWQKVSPLFWMGIFAEGVCASRGREGRRYQHTNLELQQRTGNISGLISLLSGRPRDRALQLCRLWKHPC